MTYCATCLCHIDVVEGRWVHVCRHRHVDHAPPAAISERQREERLAHLRETTVPA